MEITHNILLQEMVDRHSEEALNGLEDVVQTTDV